MIILIIVSFAVGWFALSNVPSLIRHQSWWELVVASGLTIIGFTLSILMAMGVRFPYISQIIREIIERMVKL